MTGRRVAVIGAGMTKFVRRAQETGKELSWQAASAALQSCELSVARRTQGRAGSGVTLIDPA
jgi:acetyl-CoA C-acetyltransferase